MNPQSGGDAARDQAHTLYQQAARLARLGAWECDLATEHLTWTDGTYDLFDLPIGSRLKRATVLDLYFDDSRQALEAMRAEAIRTCQGFVLDAKIRTPRGEARWMRLSVDVVCEDGRPRRLVGAKQNITSDREAWDRLRQMAERDTLTGLANRRLFEDHYNAVVADTLNYGGVAALALVDLDYFKAINDNLGHLAGDECLRQVAMRLQRIFGDAIIIARIGGDEFAVLLRAPLGPARVRHVLRRAADALSKPIFWGDRRVDIGASIGATILGRPNPRNLSDLFKEADAALYDAKAGGRRTVHIFGEDNAATARTPERDRRVA